MSCHWLVQQQRDNHRDKQADTVQAVIDKGLNSYSPTGILWDAFWRDRSYREDQTLSLHDLVSQFSIHRLTTKGQVTINGCTYPTPLDAGFCPFCAYHARCHRMLNNHVWIHLRMPKFCGVGICFFATFDSKAMISHAIAEHLDVYLKSKELTTK